ncbi:MAG: nuclear transport factor 2 family protein [Pseudomonadales bacterium]|nr:nuclear transport factor 2 family protein [Pseudomonadales bacterium]
MEIDLIGWFEKLTPGSLDDLGRYYAEDAVFQDPFQKVRGHEAIEKIFRHMFTRLEDPRFVVTSWMRRDHELCIFWEFYAARRKIRCLWWKDVAVCN